MAVGLLLIIQNCYISVQFQLYVAASYMLRMTDSCGDRLARNRNGGSERKNNNGILQVVVVLLIKST
eukprot:scaffold20012_cov179-Cylindrotheca_fusiformis.AAC.6